MSNRNNTPATATDTPDQLVSDIEKMRAMVAEFSNGRSAYAAHKRDQNLDRGLTADDFTTD